jgi:hypothetical protein
VEYLLLALVLIVAGIATVVVRNRRPTGMDASIEEFEQSLEAIAPLQAQPAPLQAQPAPPDDDLASERERGRRAG